MKYRIIFKIVLLTFKALHCVTPNYLKTLLQSYVPSRSLRSETGNVLTMLKPSRRLGFHGFAYAAPKLLNELPVTITTTTSFVSFRSPLKTHLVKATHWSTNSDITDAHISATIQRILTKFSAVVSYVKQRQIGKFQLICTWVTMLSKYIMLQYGGKSRSKNKN